MYCELTHHNRVRYFALQELTEYDVLLIKKAMLLVKNSREIDMAERINLLAMTAAIDNEVKTSKIQTNERNTEQPNPGV